MPGRRFRTGSYKVKAKRTQSGVRIHRERKGPGKARCVCGRPLSSVPHRKTSSSKSGKKSNRPHGGSLCPICAKERALRLAREESQS